MPYFLINTAQAAISLPILSQSKDLPAFISSIYSFALTIVGMAVFIRILYAGFLWLTAAGNAGKASRGKEMITNAVVGAILLFAAYLILYVINPDLVKNTFNFQLPKQESTPSTAIPPNVVTSDNGTVQLDGTIGKQPTSFHLVNTANAQAGVYPFTIRAVDAGGNSCQKQYTIEVEEQTGMLKKSNESSIAKPSLIYAAYAADDCSVVHFITDSLPNGINGARYSSGVAVSGGKGPYRFSIVDGSLPPGLTMTSGIISVSESQSDLPDFDAGKLNVSGNANASFRYLLIKSHKRHWYTYWNEIEVYDANGQKVTPVSGYSSRGKEGQASYAYDNNLETFTNSTVCGSQKTIGYNGAKPVTICAADAHMTGWVMLDYGKIISASKIRLNYLAGGGELFAAYDRAQEYSGILPWGFGVQDVLESKDMKSFQRVTKFEGLFENRQWLEFSFAAPRGNPSLSFTANGKDNLTIKYLEDPKYEWSGENVDYFDAIFEDKFDRPLRPTRPEYYYCLTWQGDDHTYNPFGGFGDLNSAPLEWPALYSPKIQTQGRKEDICRLARTEILTLKGYQTMTGKTVEKRVTVRVLPLIENSWTDWKLTTGEFGGDNSILVTRDDSSFDVYEDSIYVYHPTVELVKYPSDLKVTFKYGFNPESGSNLYPREKIGELTITSLVENPSGESSGVIQFKAKLGNDIRYYNFPVTIDKLFKK